MKFLILFLLRSCSLSEIAYNPAFQKCSTICWQEKASVVQASENSCVCSNRKEYSAPGIYP